MGDATKRVVHTVRHEYVLNQGGGHWVPASELEKAIAWATEDAIAADLATSFADTIRVTADDETITVYFEVQTR